MRRDLKRSRSMQVLTSSWLICAWISEKVLSQLIVDVAPHHWRHVNFPTSIPQIRCATLPESPAARLCARCTRPTPWRRARRSWHREWLRMGPDSFHPTSALSPAALRSSGQIRLPINSPLPGPISTFGVTSAIPITVSSDVPGTSYFCSGMRLIGGGSCAAAKLAAPRTSVPPICASSLPACAKGLQRIAWGPNIGGLRRNNRAPTPFVGVR